MTKLEWKALGETEKRTHLIAELKNYYNREDLVRELINNAVENGLNDDYDYRTIYTMDELDEALSGYSATDILGMDIDPSANYFVINDFGNFVVSFDSIAEEYPNWALHIACWLVTRDDEEDDFYTLEQFNISFTDDPVTTAPLEDLTDINIGVNQLHYRIGSLQRTGNEVVDLYLHLALEEMKKCSEHLAAASLKLRNQQSDC